MGERREERGERGERGREREIDLGVADHCRDICII